MSSQEQDRRINYLELMVTDIERNKAFFGEVFGFTFVDYGAEYCAFNDGNIDGGFALVEQATSGGPLIVFYAVDLEAVAADVVQAGGRIVRDTFSFPGGRRFHFQDPLGNNEFAVWSDHEAK